MLRLDILCQRNTRFFLFAVVLLLKENNWTNWIEDIYCLLGILVHLYFLLLYEIILNFYQMQHRILFLRCL